MIQDRARDLASKPYFAPDRDAWPEWMKRLTYDQYRDIRFNPACTLWAADNLPFRATFFHPGYLYREPVRLHEFTGSHQQEIRLSEAFFNYGPLVPQHGGMPPDGGFGGVRISTALNNPSYFDDLVVFQGASYWRALGKGQTYGISARGIAIDTDPTMREEFPGFRVFWLRKPRKGDTHQRVYALLDGPSYSGAYAFTISPGVDTVIEVHAVLFARQKVARLGLAPMSSMFWFGENSRRRFDDFRPEVHDSDGLCIRTGNGERIWRPLTNDAERNEISFFEMDDCQGFGLLQRDRKFSSYEDAEASYSKRPSLWVEPVTSWGPGRVVLMELDASNEMGDNIVALWEPANAPGPGQRYEFVYRQRWTMDPDPSLAGACVIATRTGVNINEPRLRTILIDFQGDLLASSEEEPLVALPEAIGDHASEITVRDVTLVELSGKRWRAAFHITPSDPEKELADLPPVELRCCLKRGENYLSETWAYRIKP